MTWKLQGPSRIIRNDETLTVQLYAKEYVDGKLQTRRTDEFQIRGNVQPLSDRELLIVPEHQRFREQYYVYTDEQKQIEAGSIVIRGVLQYQVQAIGYWGSYQRLRIMRVDVGQEANP